ncbi:LacI family DNA-binding transcriptional regulator [Jiangella alkaliphila]|uniref:Transcriptional regulator, LacI family n=1 Tax=Jiangella alkaliphila TaxID=419479 RepID=A0A1H2IZL2_9ACTN|nr:LacI family DNA-binding transcriptional regulator [Jiangella alkaliphila]SDU49583.1 transcriptional regulator, LacI family [Jiangella alkaliphila]
MVTIYDVARQAGVSAATVSRVLNGHVKVDPVLAGRVTDAVAQLGYRRNAVARNLRISQTTLWAVIVSDVQNPFFTSMVRGIEDVALSAGYSVVLCNSDENPEKESNYITAALAERMAGVVISPSSNRVDDVELLLQAGCPVVVIDRELDGLSTDTVLVDNEHGAQLGTAHLVEQGFRRIACIAGPRWLSTATQRLDGYGRALREAGQPVDPALVRHADFRERGGYEAMASLLDDNAAAPPDAVFAANNLMTIGAMECLVERGVTVPSDVAIVGFDAIPWADLIRPTLTTVAQPTYEVGRRAAQLLTKRLASPAAEPTRIVLPTALQIRASSIRATA